VSSAIKTIFFIAALPSMDRKVPIFLAAHKKIFFLLNVIHSMGCRLVFINSAPVMGVSKSEQITELKLGDDKSIQAIIPKTYKSTGWGRLKNIQQSKGLIKLAAKTFSEPHIVWCYNAYAFEMRAARYAENQFGSKVILEFEDWHFSRGSYFNPKAILDWFFWYRGLKSIAYCYAVNEWLKTKMERHGVPCELLPGILTNDILNLHSNCPPFQQMARSVSVRCGYFGGLSIEKGAGRVLELIKLSMEKKLSIEWHVSGKGDLEPEFLKLSRGYSGGLKFYGMVSDLELSSIVGMVDVVLNPHEHMPGVFPFKVLESVASGRLVLSTPIKLPPELDWLNSSIQIHHYDTLLWINLILESKCLYRRKENSINDACDIARSKFSFIGLRESLYNLFGSITTVS